VLIAPFIDALRPFIEFNPFIDSNPIIDSDPFIDSNPVIDSNAFCSMRPMGSTFDGASSSSLLHATGRYDAPASAKAFNVNVRFVMVAPLELLPQTQREHHSQDAGQRSLRLAESRKAVRFRDHVPAATQGTRTRRMLWSASR
jgi:hypothetical protein